MAKLEFEFCDTTFCGEWRPVEGACDGAMEKILSYDTETGNYTRLLKFPPNASIPEEAVHDFCEEVYLLDGCMKDIGKKIIAAKGFYCSRLPGMKHGPYEMPLGCLSIECRYQNPSLPIDPQCSLLKNKLGAPR